jgi:hypothetical protein
VLAQEDWEVVRFPAIAEEDESWTLDAELGQSSFTRRRGEALHPERQPLETLERIRRVPGFIQVYPGDRRITPRALRPGGHRSIPAGSVAAGRRHGQGGMVPHLRGKRAAREIRTRRPDWDTANKASELTPTLPSPACGGGKGGGCTTWGIKGKDIYLLHVLRRRMEYPELKRAVREQC